MRTGYTRNTKVGSAFKFPLMFPGGENPIQSDGVQRLKVRCQHKKNLFKNENFLIYKKVSTLNGNKNVINADHPPRLRPPFLTESSLHQIFLGIIRTLGTNWAGGEKPSSRCCWGAELESSELMVGGA